MPTCPKAELGDSHPQGGPGPAFRDRGYIVSSVHYPVRKKVNPPKKGDLGTQMVIFVVYFVEQTELCHARFRMSVDRFHVINIPCFGIL